MKTNVDSIYFQHFNPIFIIFMTNYSFEKCWSVHFVWGREVWAIVCFVHSIKCWQLWQPLTNIGGLHANMSFLKTRPIDILMTYTSYCYNIEYNSQRNVTTIEQFTKKILVGLGSTMLTNVIRTYLLVDYMVICHNWKRPIDILVTYKLYDYNIEYNTQLNELQWVMLHQPGRPMVVFSKTLNSFSGEAAQHGRSLQTPLVSLIYPHTMLGCLYYVRGVWKRATCQYPTH